MSVAISLANAQTLYATSTDGLSNNLQCPNHYFYNMIQTSSENKQKTTLISIRKPVVNAAPLKDHETLLVSSIQKSAL